MPTLEDPFVLVPPPPKAVVIAVTPLRSPVPWKPKPLVVAPVPRTEPALKVVPAQSTQRTPYAVLAALALPDGVAPPIVVLVKRGAAASMLTLTAVPEATPFARIVLLVIAGAAVLPLLSTTRRPIAVAASPARTTTVSRPGEASVIVIAEVTAEPPARSKPSTVMRRSVVPLVSPAGNDTPSSSTSWIAVVRPATTVQLVQSKPPFTSVPSTIVTSSVNVLAPAAAVSHTHTSVPPPSTTAFAIALAIEGSGALGVPGFVGSPALETKVPR
jgi:hypothetical protein